MHRTTKQKQKSEEISLFFSFYFLYHERARINIFEIGEIEFSNKTSVDVHPIS